MAFAYFTSETSENFTFFRIPKVFFKDEKLKKLSTDAKVLYGLMLDRTGLSLKNKWFDAAGRVFIYYSVTNMQDDLGLSNKTICKCVKELKEIGLVRVKRQGLTKQNIIYVLDFSRQIPDAPEDNFSDFPTDNPSGSSPDIPMDSPLDSLGAADEFAATGIEDNGSDGISFPEVDSSLVSDDVDFSRNNPEDNVGSNSEGQSELDRYNMITTVVKQNINYDFLIRKYASPGGRRIIEGVVALLADVLCFPKESVVISKQAVPYSVVKSKLERVESDHVEYVLDNILKNHIEIRNYKAYLIAALYNSVDVLDLHYHSGGF